MSRSALVVLAVLFVASAAAGSVLALPIAAQAAESPNVMLTVDSPSANDRVSQSVDVSRAVGLQREAAASEIDRHTFEAKLEDAEEGAAERARVRDEIVHLDGRIDELERSESQLRTDYVEGRIHASTYLNGLARLEAEVSGLRDQVETVRLRAEERSVDLDEVATLEARLVGYSGPVRERVGATILGEAPTVRVDVRASSNGTTLAMIEDGTHVREAYRTDYRTSNVTGTIPTDELYGSFTNRLVSEVYELEPQSTSVRGVGLGVYEVEIQGPRASPYLTISAYVDGDTRQIFSEVQEREIDQLPPTESVTATADGIQLVVNRSFPGGPLRIATYDNATGVPMSTTVEIGGDRLRTDSDGELWTLAPHRYEFQVTAASSSGNVTVEVRTRQVLSANSDS